MKVPFSAYVNTMVMMMGMWVSSKHSVGAGPGTITPDGCSVDLYALLPPGRHDADLVAAVAEAGASVLELGAGAGRVTRCLTERGLRVVAVDESAEMLANIDDAEIVVARIEELDLDRSFDVVLLGSHLVNIPDEEAAVALLRTCARHISSGGHVVVERRPPEWFDTAREIEVEQEGIRYRLTGIAHISPDVVRATMNYSIGQRTWTQTFTTRRVSDDDLNRLFHLAGLRLENYLDDERTWAKARLTDHQVP